MKRYALLFVLLAAPALASDWTQFRGRGSAATSPETGLPVKWSATENIRWKADLPGRGLSCPVIAGGRIFATLAAQHLGYGNLMLTPEQQADFVGEMPDVFIPIAGGWGRNGATHVRLTTVTEDVLAGALRTAYNLRVEKNAKSGKKTSRTRRPIRPS